MKIYTMYNLRTKRTFVGTQEDFYTDKTIPTIQLSKGQRYGDYWICIKDDDNLDIIEKEEVKTYVDELFINEPVEPREPTFNFIYKDGEIFSGTKEEFISTYNLSKGQVTKLFTGSIKTTKGWKLL